MRLKQKIATMLAVLLILLHGIPAFAMSAYGLHEPEIVTITQDSGTATGASDHQDDLSDELLEQPILTENSTAHSDEEGDTLTEPTLPEDNATVEDAPNIQNFSNAQPMEQGGIPVLRAEVVEEGDVSGVYGTLSHIPENAMDISVEYSFGGASYYFVADRSWVLDEFSPDASTLTQLCIKLDEHPYTALQSEAVNSLYIRLSISCFGGNITTEPVRFSNNKIYSIPETPPPFTAEIEYSYGGYQVNGQFESFPPDVVRIRPMYSLYGQKYKTVDEQYPNDWWLDQVGTEDVNEKYNLENQCCITYDEEPLASYVARRLERFYIRLEITTESGIYHTQAAVIEREDNTLPDNVTIKAAFPYTMRPLNEWGNPLDVSYGQYQITVREDATPETVYALLPDSLPVEVQMFHKDTGKMITSGIVQCQVSWKALSSMNLTAGQSLTIPNAVSELVVPAGTNVATPLGNYSLMEALSFGGDADSGEVRLVIDTIGANEAPDVSLQENNYENSMVDIGALSLAFRLKPSGATSITAYSFLEGEEDWREICDLLFHRDLNHNQAMGLYGFITLLQPEEAPFQDYLSAGTPFSIGLSIKGGTFDGVRVVLPWPGDYEPPSGIPEPGGSEGNENNAGNGGTDGDGDGNSGENGGQRPNLPDEGKPPVTNPSTAPSTPPSNSNGDTMPSTPHQQPETNGGTGLTNTLDDPSIIHPTEESEKVAELPSWNGTELQEQPQMKEDVQAIARQMPDAEKASGFSVAVAVLILGGGITVVSVVKAVPLIKKLFLRS